jgi:hypothetical protein
MSSFTFSTVELPEKTNHKIPHIKRRRKIQKYTDESKLFLRIFQALKQTPIKISIATAPITDAIKSNDSQNKYRIPQNPNNARRKTKKRYRGLHSANGFLFVRLILVLIYSILDSEIGASFLILLGASFSLFFSSTTTLSSTTLS